MKLAILAFALVVLTSPARADTTTFGLELGNLLASESACELKYRPEAVEALVKKEVGGDMVEFATNLSLLTSNAEFEIQRMPPLEKAAHCAEVRLKAKSHGLID